VDLRSDTITQPTAAMRHAIAEAEVGDDVFGDDPTVNELERHVAERLGKEAALFVSSGTMANQLAVKIHTQPGDEILLEAEAHIYYYEAGGPAALSGVTCHLIPGQRGVFTADQVRANLRPADIHCPPSRLICIENTHNRGGGTVWPLEAIREVAQVAEEKGLTMHMDGARLWNASVASGIPEREYAAHFRTVSVCFSKGLGAPVGSALVGPAEDIERARRFRKQWGGGMRQVGLLAAGALYALEHHRDRLADDHANARRLAQGLAEIPGIELDPDEVETNIVFFRVRSAPAQEIAERLETQGVRLLALGPDRLRAVTNLMVDRTGIERALEGIRRTLPRG
jgi:threonine aldolase